jgi:hypothetical protein
MPPRHAYWTILIDDKPTAFRAREREELLPTFHQLQRKNTNVVMQWFARGRLWESQEREHEDFQRRKRAGGAPAGRSASAGGEKRAADWRPGGQHKDPRDRFKKKNRPERAWSDGDGSSARRDREKLGPPRSPDGQEARRSPPDRRATGGGWRDKPHCDRAWSNKPPKGGPRSDRPWSNKPPGGDRPSDRPWSNKPPTSGPRTDRPWRDKPPSGGQPPRDGRSPDRRASAGGWRDKPQGDRAWSNKPPTGGPRSDRPRSNNPPGGDRPSDRPWSNKPPTGGPRSDRPWRDKPPSGGPPSPDGREARRDSPDHRASGGGWSHKPAGGAPRSDRPMQNRKEPNTAAGSGGPQADRKPDDNAPRKRRDEDPDRD